MQLKFSQYLSSHRAAEGDPVALVLSEDLTVNNVVVAKAGDKAVGEVSHAKRAGMMGKGGELNIPALCKQASLAVSERPVEISDLQQLLDPWMLR